MKKQGLITGLTLHSHGGICLCTQLWWRWLPHKYPCCFISQECFVTSLTLNPPHPARPNSDNWVNIKLFPSSLPGKKPSSLISMRLDWYFLMYHFLWCECTKNVFSTRIQCNFRQDGCLFHLSIIRVPFEILIQEHLILNKAPTFCLYHWLDIRLTDGFIQQVFPH